MENKSENSSANIGRKISRNGLILSGIFAAVLFVLLTFLNQDLKNPVAPQGMISYELAHDVGRSLNILASWDGREKTIAAFSLGIDYFFLVAYALFFALSCYVAAGKIKKRLAGLYRAGIVLAVAQILAAILDALENYGLFRLLLGSQNAVFAQLAFYAATLKFSFIFMGILYILIALMLAMRYRKQE